MNRNVLALALLALSPGLANAGEPVIGSANTFVCEGAVSGETVSLTGTLDGLADSGLPTPQDHVRSVTGEVTLQISSAQSNFVRTYEVEGSQNAGVPSFPTGEGYKLFETNTNSIVPALSVTVSMSVFFPRPTPGHPVDGLVTRAATIQFGQSPATELACQLISFDL